MNRTQLLSSLFAISIIVGAYFGIQYWWPHKESKVADASSDAASTPELVVLTEAKAAEAKIQVRSVVVQNLQLLRTLPARLTYDDRQHVSVRAAAPGIIAAIHVKPGDIVQRGQVIATLKCPSIAEARSEVLKRKAELELARRQSEWQSEICDGVAQVAKSVLEGKPIESIETQLGDVKLGHYREKLFTSYSKATLTATLSDAAAEGADAISGKVRTQRESEQQQAASALNAEIEQSLFETEQQCKVAQSQFEVAQRSVDVAIQKLATLTGQADEDALKLNPESVAGDLSLLSVRAPLAGTVERRVFSAAERVDANDEMFVIANTDRLWVEADIRGRDWTAIEVQQEDDISVRIPADPNVLLIGKVYYVGREVDVSTGAVPLIVEVPNPNGNLRPGLFARVDVPVGQLENVLVIPRSAVLDIEGHPSVFVESGAGYRPASVQLGAESGTLVQVLSGIEADESIVVEGAFILKSEFLLEGEE